MEAIAHTTSFMQGIDDVAALERDPKAQDAIIRCIEIIGEAASKVQNHAPEFIEAHPEIPWAANAKYAQQTQAPTLL